jgi:hypothetical protein
MLAAPTLGGKIALELAPAIGLPDQIAERDTATIQEPLDARGEDHAAMLHEGPEEHPAADFTSGVLQVQTLEVRKRLKFVEGLESRVRSEQPLDSRLKEPVSKALGAEFWKMLQEYTPANIIALHLVADGLDRLDAYDLEHSGTNPTPEQEEEYRQAESFTRIQMRTKLVHLEKLHLQVAFRYLKQSEAGGVGTATCSDRLDLFLRYASTARREFYRTLNSYLEIKKKRI